MAGKETKQKNIIEVFKDDFSNLKNKINKDKAQNKSKKVKEAKNRSGLWAKIGFGLSIVSLVSWLYPLAGLVVSITAIVFNLLGLKAERGRWFAVAGFTIALVTLNVSMLYYLYSIIISTLYGGASF